MTTKNKILDQLDIVLTDAGYRSRAAHEVVACYTRKTLNANRAIVVLECPDSRDPCEFAREMKGVCLRATGFYIPFLYQLALQIVVLGPAKNAEPEKSVDVTNRPLCILQAIYVVDLKAPQVVTGVTWARSMSRELQEAIDKSLRLTVRPDLLHNAPGLIEHDPIREAAVPFGLGFAKRQQDAMETKVLPKGAGSWIYALLGIAVIGTVAVVGSVLLMRLFQ